MSECVKNVVSWVSQVGDKVGKGTSALIDALPSLKEDHHVVMVRLFLFLFTLRKNISAVCLQFIFQGLIDRKEAVRKRMLTAAVTIVDIHGNFTRKKIPFFNTT